MPRRPKDFPESARLKVLLWCNRHCCLCGKRCGANIEVAHIAQDGGNDLDNAIPLCFECHADIGRYDAQHPKGKKYSFEELKKSRNQIYEHHTAHLVPPLVYFISQEKTGRTLPDVGFVIHHGGDKYPVRVNVNLTICQGGRRLTDPSLKGHYDGTWPWNLNPRFGVSGHFNLSKKYLERPEIPVSIEIFVRVTDIHDRVHDLLPVWYVNGLRQGVDWYLEPSKEALSKSP